nr:hypothetical protein [Bradyrhizobium diazoefficiens]
MGRDHRRRREGLSRRGRGRTAVSASGRAAADARSDGVAAARHFAGWLALAATPTFAIMALVTAVLGGGPADLLCAAGHGSALGGMVPMYLLMSAFHSSAWLRLIAERRGGQRSRSV